MLNDAVIKDKMRRGFWAECTSTAEFNANILVNLDSGKPPHELMFGVKISKLRNLKRFGEMVVVITKKGSKKRSAIAAQLGTHRIICIVSAICLISRQGSS
jgi:hypothetical protein